MKRFLARLVGGIALAAMFSGCTFAQRTSVAMLDGRSAPQAPGGGAASRSAHRTSIAMLDGRSSPPTSGVGAASRGVQVRPIDVYQQGKKPTRAYREIALFTVDGEGREEADALQGFINLGRRCGADAILMDRTMTLQKESGGRVVDSQTKESVAGGAAETIYYPNGRCVFRATAVVWTDETKGLSVAH